MKGHGNAYGPYIQTFAWELYNYMPDGYFEKAHAPLLTIEYKESVFA